MNSKATIATTAKGMRRGWLKIYLILILISSFLLVPVASAQETGWEESFDDSTLDGWELGPEVVVADGALIIGSGNFAARGGEFSDFQFTFKVRLDESEGAFSLIYYAREESEYALRFLPEEIMLERRSGGPFVGMARAQGTTFDAESWNEFTVEVSGGDHRLLLNNDEIFTAHDESPLRAGGLVFVNMGPADIAVDDLVFEGQVAEEEGIIPMPEGEPEGAPPEGAPIEEPPPEEMPAVEGEGAAPAQEPPGFLTLEGDEAQGGIIGTIQELLSIRAQPIALQTFVLNMFLAVILAYILGVLYIHWGTSLSNRRKFAGNFMLITLTTTFIILVVRSSVALSLGLVGALSIVRFRTAIKEPEELAYLFLAIGLGIGLGDNQRVITLIVMVVAVLVVGISHLFRTREADVNLHLSVASSHPDKVGMESIIRVLEPYCEKLKLMRFDETDSELEASFLVELREMSQLQSARNALRELSPSLAITFLDNRGIQ